MRWGTQPRVCVPPATPPDLQPVPLVAPSQPGLSRLGETAGSDGAGAWPEHPSDAGCIPAPRARDWWWGGGERMTVLRSGVTLSGCDGGYSQGVRRSRACRANRVSLGDPEETETGVSTGSEGGEQPHVFPPPTSPSSLRTTPGSGPSTHLLSRRSHGTLWSWETLKHRDGGGGSVTTLCPPTPTNGAPSHLAPGGGKLGVVRLLAEMGVLTCVPGVPCWPGGPGSPCGPWDSQRRWVSACVPNGVLTGVPSGT